MLFFTLFTAFFRDLIDVLELIDKISFETDAPKIGSKKKPKPKNDFGLGFGM